MQLLSLKTAIQGILALADQQKSQNERQLFYLHTCQALTLLLEAPGESGPGWPRAALALLRPLAERQSGPLAATTRALTSRQLSRPLVEVMPSASLPETQEHLLTVLELPEIVSIDSLADVQAMIENAIAVGAPRYNRGDIAGCARLYLATALTLVNAQINRGFSGQARALDTLKKGLAEAQMLPSVDERAWALRHAFDRVLK
ncbi:MAG TPA: hypothetical protein VKT82_29230 [Ktedonobacterales bacterium]|nr:hypothetical protein [Ktedonobacterales bacterium]